jgi:hypothetical protein
MADLLGGDGLNEVLILGGGTAEVDALEKVLHHRAHLAELAAQALLEGIRGEGVRLVRHDLIDEFLHVEKHGGVLVSFRLAALHLGNQHDWQTPRLVSTHRPSDGGLDRA